MDFIVLILRNRLRDDLYFMCTMVGHISRFLQVRNKDIINALGYNELYKKISLASEG